MIQTEHVYVFNETVVNEDSNDHRRRSIYRDKDIPNRFWFQFPSELRTRERNENIIGIRSCVLTNGDRHCKFILDIRKTEKSTGKVNEISLGIGSHISKFDSFEDFIKDIRWFVRRTRIANEEEWKTQGIPIIDEYNIGYKFERDPVTNIMSFVVEGRDQYNEYGSEAGENESEAGENEVNDEPEVLYYTELQIQSIDKDGQMLLLTDNPSNEYSSKIYFPRVWDREPVLLKSNLAMNSIGNYIGYTNSVFNPIKYFKLTSNDSYFWIEMYNGTDHISPAVIPMDGKDSFILEIVILQ